MPIKKVFLSSTARDLKEYREAAYRAIEGLDGYHCVRMEDFGARNWDADEFCRAKVEECDLFVGILGHLYGSCPEGSDQSYTEREYEVAFEAGKPMLMFVAPRDFPVPADLIESDEMRKKQKAFRERVSKDRMRADFKSPDNLALGVTQAIGNEDNKRPLTEKRSSRVPFLAPPLPEHFIPRPDKSEEVKHRLLTCNSDRPGVLVVSALHGLGGIGKTVLAASLAHNKEVRNHFSDGILWATLGKEPDLLSLLSGWIQALGDYEFRPTTPEAASMYLSTLLHDKMVLLVVDDAWNSAHVQPFRIGGPHCSLLITTRDSLIADAVDARVYDLDVMTEGQSLALLSKRLGRELGETERQEALDLAKEVGYLPLALNLIAAQVEDGVSWAELLGELRAEIARLEALETPGVEELDEKTRKDRSLRASFQLSLQSLPEERRIAFAWLGVLPEDVLLSPKMATTLWDVDLRRARETLRYLRNKALLQSGPKHGDVQTYLLHDLLHDFAKNLMSAPATSDTVTDLPGLGLTVQEAHSKLLERYRSRTRDGLWHTLPDDGYIHAHLVWHMEKADRIEVIHSLLQEETPEGRNGWYEARDSLGQTGRFIEDVARAWKLAEDENKLDLEILYALTATSINSLSANIPPELIARLVEYDLWTIDQGQSYALQIPNLNKRDHALVKLSQSICTQNPKEALAIAHEILNEHSKSKVLSEIAQQLEDPHEVLAEALSIARGIDSEYYRAKAIADIALKLEDPQVAIMEALSVARGIDSEYYRAKAIADIAPRVEDSEEVLKEALSIARGIDSASLSDLAIAHIAPKFENPQEALSITAEIRANKTRYTAIADIAPRLEDPQQGLRVAREIPDKRKKSRALAYIAPRLKDPQQARSVAREIPDKRFKSIALTDIAPKLEDPQVAIKEALEVAREIPNERSKFRALYEIARKLEDSHEALSIASEISVKHIKVSLFVDIALKCPYPHEALKEALRVARKIDDSSFKYKFSDVIRTDLSKSSKIIHNDVKLFGPQEPLKKALAIIRMIEPVASRDKALFDIVPKIEDPHESLSIAREINSKSRRDKAIFTIVPRIEDPQEGFIISCEIGIQYFRDRALAELAPKLMEISPHIFRPLWRNTLHILSQRTRKDLLSDLVALVSVILALGGQEALEETDRAIQDVGRWWP